MELGRTAFAVAFGLGLAGLSTVGIADGPEGPGAPADVPKRVIARGLGFGAGALGFLGNPGPGKVAGCEVSARVAGDEVVIEVKGADAAAKAACLELAGYDLKGSPESRMGPMLIEAYRAPLRLEIDARTGIATARVPLDEKLRGARHLMIEPTPEKRTQIVDRAYVLELEKPAAEPERS